jgi:hypothetical protein
MSFQLRTSLHSLNRRWRRSRQLPGWTLATVLLALLSTPTGCDGDEATVISGGSSGHAGRGHGGQGGDDGNDGSFDAPSSDRSGGAGGAQPEAGARETGREDGTETDASRDGAESDSRDASSRPDTNDDVDDDDAPVDTAADSDDWRDATDDAEEDASGDALDSGSFDAPADVPRDTGPIVIGPPFWRSATFAVFGDYGMASTDEARVANLVQSWDVDFVITTGDNNYTGLSDGIDGVIGRYYSDFIGNYWGAYGSGSRTTRFWPSPGNHDWDVADLVAYTDYFTLPGNERYYDVNLGLVHLFAVDSDPREPDGTTADSVQGQWLRARLARSNSCFNIVYFHHPAYSSGPHGSSLDMRWPFEAWGADVVLAGHDHVYERFEVGQIPYFTVGLGGGAPYPFVTTVPESRAQFNSDFGAMRVTATRRGMRFEFIDANGNVIETFDSRKRCR